MTDDKDWRKSAYLRKENWPEAIPYYGPRREYGPYPWTEPDHDQYGIDEYPYSHPDAASIGHYYIGDVCPMCGVPLRGDEIVITKTGEQGELLDVSPHEKPEPAYHPACYDERQERLQTRQQELLTEAGE